MVAEWIILNDGLRSFFRLIFVAFISIPTRFVLLLMLFALVFDRNSSTGVFALLTHRSMSAGYLLPRCANTCTRLRLSWNWHQLNTLIQGIPAQPQQTNDQVYRRRKPFCRFINQRRESSLTFFQRVWNGTAPRYREKIEPNSRTAEMRLQN